MSLQVCWIVRRYKPLASAWAGGYMPPTSRRSNSLPQALLAYRGEYLIEHGFARLEGRPLSLAPTYLHSEAGSQA